MQFFIILIFLFQLPMVRIDSLYYGKLVVAPFNIVFYNVFTSHGPDLYGTEPWTYYLFNGFLNFNFIFIFSLITPFVLVSQKFTTNSTNILFSPLFNQPCQPCIKCKHVFRFKKWTIRSLFGTNEYDLCKLIFSKLNMFTFPYILLRGQQIVGLSERNSKLRQSFFGFYLRVCNLDTVKHK